MSKYIETPMDAATYQRCSQIIIANPYQAPPVVTFSEEQIIKRADGSVLHDALLLPISKTFSDPAYAFPIYNPTNQQKTGQSATVAQVYALIWSVYMFEATKRDATKAKDAVLAQFEATAMAAMAAAIASAKPVRDAFSAQDAVDKAALLAAIATAATQDEKDAATVAYDIARSAKLAASEAQANALVNDQIALNDTQRVQAVIDAQAAYDSVMAA
jgi:hypothetical protein